MTYPPNHPIIRQGQTAYKALNEMSKVFFETGDLFLAVEILSLAQEVRAITQAHEQIIEAELVVITISESKKKKYG